MTKEQILDRFAAPLIGLLGFEVVSFMSVLSIEKFNEKAEVAFVFLAISLPCLLGSIIIIKSSLKASSSRDKLLGHALDGLMTVGVISGFLWSSALFRFVSTTAANVFLVTGCFVIFLWSLIGGNRKEKD